MNNSAQKPCCINGCANMAHARAMCRKHYMRWWTHGSPDVVKFHTSPAGAPHAFLEGLPLTGNGCVHWPFATNNQGYAQIGLPGGRGRKALVSRLVCERVNGPPPSLKHQAAHTCGKGHEGCIAPWHLIWKTAKENAADQWVHGTKSFGDRHATKLNEVSVAAILSLKGTASQARIAAEFGVSQTMVSRIFRRAAWAHCNVDPATLEQQGRAA